MPNNIYLHVCVDRLHDLHNIMVNIQKTRAAKLVSSAVSAIANLTASGLYSAACREAGKLIN